MTCKKKTRVGVVLASDFESYSFNPIGFEEILGRAEAKEKGVAEANTA